MAQMQRPGNKDTHRKREKKQLCLAILELENADDFTIFVMLKPNCIGICIRAQLIVLFA